MTKVTLQTYIVNKQIVARNIYYSLYRELSPLGLVKQGCVGKNFRTKCMYDLEYNSLSASGKTLYIFVQRHDVNRS